MVIFKQVLICLQGLVVVLTAMSGSGIAETGSATHALSEHRPQKIRVISRREPPTPPSRQSKAMREKLSPRLQQTLRRLEEAGIGRESPAAPSSPERFSTPLVRLDDQGRVQVVLLVTEVTPSLLKSLEETGMVIERANERYGLIQGWIPVSVLERIAELPAVTQIEPPDYAVPR